MAKYELTILIDDGVTVADMLALEKKIKGHMTIKKRNINGVKRLAYPIRGKEYAMYLFYVVETDYKNSVSELNGELCRDDKVVRFLMVKQDTNHNR